MSLLDKYPFFAKTAKEAIYAAEAYIPEEVEKILKDISKEAVNGNRVLHYYRPIDDKTVNNLRMRGFVITDKTPKSVQNAKHYYIIEW